MGEDLLLWMEEGLPVPTMTTVMFKSDNLKATLEELTLSTSQPLRFLLICGTNT